MGNWEGVTEFVAVAETGSFTVASKQLGISTAQVSRQVSALEKRLATRLFYRTTRKVSVTDAGQTYYQHCRPVLDGLEEAERALSQLQSEPRGKLKITAPTLYGESRIAPLLNNFVARFPELDVQFSLTNQKVDLVEGGFDLAIRLGKLESSSMMAKRLASRHQYVCAAPDYIATHGKPRTLTDLAHHNCLLGTLDYWRFQENGHERVIRVHGNIRCNSGQVLLDAALKGLGIVQLPDTYIEPYISKGTLISLLQDFQPSDEGVWAIYPHNRHLSPKVRLLVDYLGESLQSL
ncbi:LysR family transcriptional regulator [Marinobacter sp. BGYM27]|uniref:LysR family transcriptional regulator n=1 Tax=Marinobacter sp. V034 TaxID=3459610 RepID=UPI0021A74B3E|nr:LysR family transcriptional regulator [Marinobacter sp. BGYM27]MDG5501293.1 LysR family transcriptional regulator [Marinobacter sp. BGYM27]